ncbi:MAG: type II toxin-antitoxin system VapC family toxin [Propionibacteriaceae bacterium]|jgi:predicted nucleic-acid-binding protein|nr:type II toxin-antitoxin system VapC family toxin [Propionibacteriaceae bacterium]
MIGLETNVLVRALTGDDDVQSPVARRFLESLTPDEPGFVSLVALVETLWVLRQHEPYRYTREQVYQVVDGLLRATTVVVEMADVVRSALAVARRTGREVPDALVASAGGHAGCDRTVTFDRRATAIPGMTLLGT